VPARCQTPLLLMVLVLCGCSPGDEAGVESGGTEEGMSLQDSMRKRIDPSRQLFRFASGVCRDLDRLPSPWREYSSRRYEKRGSLGQRFPPGYDWGPGSDIAESEVTLEADYATLGVPPANTLPGRIRRSGLSQDVALLSLGPSLGVSPHWIHLKLQDALSAAHPDWRVQQAISLTTHLGDARLYVPVQAPFPVSDRYGVYAWGPKERVSNRSSMLIINPAQRAGVYCDPDYDLPNPSCMGLILLNDEEVATIDVNYEALGRLDEVVASMTHAAHVIRTSCADAGAQP